MTGTMTRAKVEFIVREAREAGRTPDLYGVNLSGLDLHGLGLRGADLRYSNLYGANLDGTDLFGAKLIGASGVVQLGETPSGEAWMVPTVGGWRISIGCWLGKSLDDLFALLDAPDDHWPEARGAERDAREPILYALFKYAEAQATYRQSWMDAVIERWGEKEKDA